MPDVSLNGIEFTIKGSSDKASDSIEELRRKLDGLKSSLSGTAKTSTAIRKVGSAAKSASKPLANFANSIKRIAMYRAIRSIIKSITEALKEGAESFYNFTKQSGGAFANYAKALDGVRASSSQMKNQLGAAWGTLYTMIAPIITNLISLVTKLANALTMIFARISGASGWYKATEAAAGAIDDVGGAAKEALKYLAPFDELNRLPDKRSGGGGGGGSDGGGYEWVDFEQFNIGDGLRDIVQWFTDAFNNIADWIENVDWQNLASTIVTEIGNAFNEVDWNGLAQSIARFIGAAIGAVAGFLVGALSDLVTSISDAIYNAFHNDDGTRKTGEEIWNGICEGIKNAITNVWTWVKENILNPFVEGFKKAFGIASPAKEMEEPGQMVGEGILAGIAKPFVKIGEWINEHILQPIKDFFSGLTGDPVVEIGVSLIKSGWETVSGWFSGLGTKVTTAWATIQTWLDKAKDSKWGWTTVQGWLNGLGEKVNTGWAKAQVYLARTTQGDYKWSSITSWVKEKAGEGWAKAQVYFARTTSGDYKWTSITSWVKEKAGEGWAKAQVYLNKATGTDYAWTTVSGWIQQYMGGGVNKAIGLAKGVWSTVASWIQTDNMGGEVNKAIGLSNATWTTVAQWIINNNLIGGAVSIGVTLFSKFGSTVTAWLSDKLGSLGFTVTANASGGAFYSNSWHSIPQYASGGSPHGSLFIAGEAGAELVGHIGGRTEVLNQSQIASAIAFGVSRHLNAGGYENGATEDVLYRAFRRALDETDFGGDVSIDGDVLYRKMVDRNRAATYRTGANPMMSMA